MSLAQHAEKKAKSNRDVAEMIAASNQWLSIAMVHSEIYDRQDAVKKRIGFIGGNNG